MSDNGVNTPTSPAPSDSSNAINFDNKTMMIALYYCYTPQFLSPTNTSKHTAFQKQTCQKFNLNGRIRVSYEGINGVLSGTYQDLKCYEEIVHEELIRLCEEEYKAKCVDKEEMDDGLDVKMDVKYCHLRRDIPIEKQLFDSLAVKETREVVSLHEQKPRNVDEIDPSMKKGFWRRRRRNRNKKGNGKNLKGTKDINAPKQNAAGSLSVASEEHDDKSPTTADTDNKDKNGENTNTAPSLPDAVTPQPQPPTEPLDEIDLTKIPTATHLSPQEWNEKLLSASSNTTQKQQQQEDNPMNKSSNAILLDTRNIYESRIGHFTIPSIPTIIPYTRKYSSLPSILRSSEFQKSIAGKEIYMYCTGGVRCERASSFLKALTEREDEWDDKLERPKGIYQLKGGIQRYLEEYGTNTSAVVADGKCDDGENRGEKNDEKGEEQQEAMAKAQKEKDSNDAHENEQSSKQCLYRGKNFVFDPRRTDPVVGIVHDNNSNSETKCVDVNTPSPSSMVGKCLLCNIPHDDYDNGYAPVDEKESRCCRCRCLVLVCNDCRKKVICWGEEENVDGNDEKKDERESEKKPKLFCGPNGTSCIDEGNSVDLEIIYS